MNELNQLKKLTESIDRINESNDPAVDEAAAVLADWSLDDDPQALLDYFTKLAMNSDSAFSKDLRGFLRVASVDDPGELQDTFIDITNKHGGNIEIEYTDLLAIQNAPQTQHEKDVEAQMKKDAAEYWKFDN